MAGCCVSFLKMISLSGVFVLGLVGVFTLIGFEKLKAERFNEETNKYENITKQRGITFIVAGCIHLMAFIIFGVFMKEKKKDKRNDIIYNDIKNEYNKEIKKEDNDNNDNNLISDNKINENHKMSPTEEAIFTGIQRLPITLSMTSEDRLNE